MRVLQVSAIVLLVVVVGALTGAVVLAPGPTSAPAPAPAAPAPLFPAAVPAPGSDPAGGGGDASSPGVPCTDPGVRACVDLSDRRAWLLDDGAVVRGPVPVTHGAEGYRTRQGTFTVSFHSRDHVSSIYDAPMPFAVFFDGDIAFHEGSLQEDSHGCVHLSPADAEAFFDTLADGDRVQVVA